MNSLVNIFSFVSHYFQSHILPEIRRKAEEEAPIFEEQHYTQYVELLGAYAAAIRDEKITRDRNQFMFTIASEELGRFVARHVTVSYFFFS